MSSPEFHYKLHFSVYEYDKKKNYEDSWVAAHYEDSWVAALVRKILEPAMSELFTSCPIRIEHRMITRCVRTKSESHEGSSRLLNYMCGSCSRAKAPLRLVILWACLFFNLVSTPLLLFLFLFGRRRRRRRRLSLNLHRKVKRLTCKDCPAELLKLRR